MRRFALGLAALSLSACQTVSDMTGGSSVPADEPAVTAPAVTQPSAAPSSAAPSGGLIGMTADALRAAWGEPSLKRNETGTEFWQYGGRGTCTLLVYFYANASSVMTVTHAEALPGGTDETAIASCAKAAGKPPVKPIS